MFISTPKKSNLNWLWMGKFDVYLQFSVRNSMVFNLILIFSSQWFSNFSPTLVLLCIILMPVTLNLSYHHSLPLPFFRQKGVTYFVVCYFSKINTCVCFQLDLKAHTKNEGCIKSIQQTSSIFFWFLWHTLSCA